MKCGTCFGSGKIMATVNHTGADGEPYQGVEHQDCPACHGTGEAGGGQ